MKTFLGNNLVNRLLANPYGSLTHPARDRRLAAIERGWLTADGGYNGETPMDKEEAVVVVHKPKKEKLNKSLYSLSFGKGKSN